jgi:hypothetical protein
MNTETQTMRQPAKASWQSRQSSCQGTLLSMDQTAQLSGVNETDLLSLVAYGALAPAVPGGKPYLFDISCVIKLQRADRVRQDLALDHHGFAMALMLFHQITKSEMQLHSTQRDGLVDGLSDSYAM